jgi:single-strand DNA-binding protein
MGGAHPTRSTTNKNMSDRIEVKGTVEKLLEIQEFASGYKKQTLVIDTGGKYPQKIAIDFGREKIDLISKLTEGQEVTVGVNFRGSEYNGKYYVSLNGWKVDAGKAVENDEDQGIPF